MSSACLRAEMATRGALASPMTPAAPGASQLPLEVPWPRLKQPLTGHQRRQGPLHTRRFDGLQQTTAAGTAAGLERRGARMQQRQIVGVPELLGDRCGLLLQCTEGPGLDRSKYLQCIAQIFDPLAPLVQRLIGGVS